jgi:hypothetical protein
MRQIKPQSLHRGKPESGRAGIEEPSAAAGNGLNVGPHFAPHLSLVAGD